MKLKLSMANMTTLRYKRVRYNGLECFERYDTANAFTRLAAFRRHPFKIRKCDFDGHDRKLASHHRLETAPSTKQYQREHAKA